MAKMKPQVKEGENHINSRSDFLWGFIQLRFQSGISYQCPVGSTYLAIVGNTHSDISTLYLIQFNRFRSCHTY